MTRDQAIEIISKMHGDTIGHASDEFHKRWCAEWVDMFVKMGMLKLTGKPSFKVKMGRQTINENGLKLWDPKDCPDLADYYKSLVELPSLSTLRRKRCSGH